jgi:RNA polymerase sigma-70 factor (ECF subfamily)
MQPDIDDLQAIRRLKRGDIGGLELLVARYQAKAIRTAFLVTHDEPMAEDVVQDVFVRFFEHADRFDETRPFGPLFMRSVVNTALNTNQREKKGNRLQEKDASELETLLNKAASIDEQMESGSLNRQILEALSKLPPQQRAVIIQIAFIIWTNHIGFKRCDLHTPFSIIFFLELS